MKFSCIFILCFRKTFAKLAKVKHIRQNALGLIDNFAIVAVAVWEAAVVANVVGMFTAWVVTAAAFWELCRLCDDIWHERTTTSKELIIADLLNL